MFSVKYFPFAMGEGTSHMITLFSIKCNSTKLSGPVYGIVTKTVHKTQPRSLFVCQRQGFVQLLPIRKFVEVVC